MSLIFHRATVLKRQSVTPGMVRLTFGGEGMKDFAGTGIGDEYLRLFFPMPETGEVLLPFLDEKGRWTYPQGKKPTHAEPYTVRRHDAESGEIDIDFVVHEGGIASDWARQAQQGDEITITNPHGLYEPPGDTRWQVLTADATGLPAIGRLLEQTPEHIHSRVIVEIAQEAHKQALSTIGECTVTWLVGSGNGISGSRLAEAVRSLPLPPTPGYIWVAGEQKVVRSIRKYLRHELKLPSTRYKAVGYWIEKLAEWEKNWEALDPAVRKQIDAAWDSERDREEVRDEVDATLEKFGL